MEKNIVSADDTARAPVAAWLDLEACVRVRLTSEDPARPIESALKENDGASRGWRAAQPGAQTIWLQFDVPRAIRRIHLGFEVAERRTQEFALAWSNDGGATYREIVRQQFNFSPEGAAHEEEDYSTHLSGITDLRLTIVPDISGGGACASLREWRVA